MHTCTLGDAHPPPTTHLTEPLPTRPDSISVRFVQGHQDSKLSVAEAGGGAGFGGGYPWSDARVLAQSGSGWCRCVGDAWPRC